MVVLKFFYQNNVHVVDSKIVHYLEGTNKTALICLALLHEVGLYWYTPPR